MYVVIICCSSDCTKPYKVKATLGSNQSARKLGTNCGQGVRQLYMGSRAVPVQPCHLTSSAWLSLQPNMECTLHIFTSFSPFQLLLLQARQGTQLHSQPCTTTAAIISCTVQADSAWYSKAKHSPKLSNTVQQRHGSSCKGNDHAWP